MSERGAVELCGSALDQATRRMLEIKFSEQRPGYEKGTNENQSLR